MVVPSPSPSFVPNRQKRGNPWPCSTTGAILPAYDAMLGYPIHHVLVRHEQGATHMADGYARASGRVGVAIATSGPGATNMVTGIATAMLDSVPMVYSAPQTPSDTSTGVAPVTVTVVPDTAANAPVIAVEEVDCPNPPPAF